MRSQSEISLARRAAADRSWASTVDRAARTEPARRAFIARFLDQVPAEITDPADRLRAAESLRRAHYLELSRRSIAARRARREAVA